MEAQTPESQSVTPQIKYANFLERYSAFAFDFYIFVVPTVLIFYVFQPTKDLFQKLYDSNKLFWDLAVSLLYFGYLIVTTKLYGKSLGKHILKLRIIPEDNKPIGWGRAVVREFLVRLISDIFFLGYLYSLFNKKRQTFHDKVTNIIVVEEIPLNILRKLLIIFVVILIPIILVILSMQLSFKNIQIQRDTQDLAEAVDQKLSLLESVKSTCNSINNNAKNYRKNYCYKAIGKKEECELTKIKLEDLKEFSIQLGNMTTECIDIQYKLQGNNQ